MEKSSPACPSLRSRGFKACRIATCKAPTTPNAPSSFSTSCAPCQSVKTCKRSSDSHHQELQVSRESLAHHQASLSKTREMCNSSEWAQFMWTIKSSTFKLTELVGNLFKYFLNYCSCYTMLFSYIGWFTMILSNPSLVRSTVVKPPSIIISAIALPTAGACWIPVNYSISYCATPGPQLITHHGHWIQMQYTSCDNTDVGQRCHSRRMCCIHRNLPMPT